MCQDFDSKPPVRMIPINPVDLIAFAADERDRSALTRVVIVLMDAVSATRIDRFIRNENARHSRETRMIRDLVSDMNLADRTAERRTIAKYPPMPQNGE